MGLRTVSAVSPQQTVCCKKFYRTAARRRSAGTCTRCTVAAIICACPAWSAAGASVRALRTCDKSCGPRWMFGGFAMMMMTAMRPIGRGVRVFLNPESGWISMDIQAAARRTLGCGAPVVCGSSEARCAIASKTHAAQARLNVRRTCGRGRRLEFRLAARKYPVAGYVRVGLSLVQIWNACGPQGVRGTARAR